MKNVTEEEIKKYIKEFHRTLDEVASRFFSSEQSKHLLHRSLLPARIICYVSTQFGVAFEYIPASSISIETIRGSARAEDLLVRAPKKLRDVGPLFNIGGSNTEIAHLTLANGFPFRLSDRQANVILRDVRFKAFNWVREVQYAEVYADRSASTWSMTAAQNRAKDEVLAALFLTRQAESKKLTLSDYISSSREKTVLVLGAYDDKGKRRLSNILKVLRDLGYEPVLVEEIPDFEHYDLSQKVVAIAALSRFIVIDDSSPSGHLTEIELCKQNRWVTILLRAYGHSASSMTRGASYFSKVILEKEYDPGDPTPAITESIKWAEDKLNELQVGLNKIYPWRTGKLTNRST